MTRLVSSVFQAFAGLTLTIHASAIPAHAEDRKLFDWHATDIQFLHGFDYELGDAERTIVTFQHANGWTYGDNYLFFDKTFGSSPDYFEWHPRLSLSKISGQHIGGGILKDVLFAGTLEVPENGSARFLAGVGLDWKLLEFDYLKTNFYIRENPDLPGTTWGSTFSWKKKFGWGEHKFQFDGFMDMAGSEGDRVAYQLISPAFLIDVGHYFGNDGRLFAGTEYQYWHNKFGVAGVTESVAQIELRWVIK